MKIQIVMKRGSIEEVRSSEQVEVELAYTTPDGFTEVVSLKNVVTTDWVKPFPPYKV